MNSPSTARSWSRQTWCAAITLLFLLQVGLIWRFSPRETVKVATPTVLPDIKLSVRAPLTGQANPLFLSHVAREGFSGSAWLQPTPLPHPTLEWATAPSGCLQLSNYTLGLSVAGLMDRLVPAASPIRLPDIQLAVPTLLPPPRLGFPPSRLHVEGELAERAPRELPTLPDWTNEFLLRPTVLEIGVDARGNVVSIVPGMRSEILADGGALRGAAPGPATSGNPGADRFAEETALALRFKPLPGAGSLGSPGSITHGTLIFEWRTLPANITNEPARTP
jgi:hypothetical protein